MKRRFSIFLVTLVLTSSCSYPGTVLTNPPEIPATGQTSTSTALIPTSTSIPIETLLAASEIPTVTVTLTSTPSLTLASPRQQPVNCRVGPDISYAVIGALLVGRQAEVIGKNIDITWLYVRNPSDPSNNCWLSVDFIDVKGSVDLLPVVGPPEIMVTSIKVSVDPVAMNVACDALPQSVVVSAQITTNGPSVVTWFWESSAGKTSQQKQILFEAGTTKLVQDYYQADKVGDYVIQVKTVVPNMAKGEANFKVICTP
jgi:hypothetical protein